MSCGGNSSSAVDCESVNDDGDCGRLSGCAWCASTRECVSSCCGQASDEDCCCLDKWSSDSPEDTIPCYRDNVRSSCRACLQAADQGCMWCASTSEDGCGSEGFCTASFERRGRSLECDDPRQRLDECPSGGDRLTIDISLEMFFAWASAILVFLCLLVVGVKLFVRWRLGARRRAQEREMREIALAFEPPAGMRPSATPIPGGPNPEARLVARLRAIDALPERRAGSHGKQAHTECSICLQEYEQGELLLTLPCMHVFHKQCATRWLLEPESAGECPQCKAPITS